MLSVKAGVKKALKTSALGRKVYPAVQACYRSVAIPLRCRRLRCEGWGALRRIHAVLSEGKVPYYLDYGTLLGLVRDGGFIPNDCDLDLSVLPGRAIPQDVLRLFLAAGFSFVHGFEVEGRLCEFTVRDSSGLTLDVFFPRRVLEKPGYIAGYDIFWEPGRHYPSERANTVVETYYSCPEKVRIAVFHGVEVSIPEDAERLLQEEFGAGWRVPDPTFVARDVIPCHELEALAFRLTSEEMLAFPRPQKETK